MGVSTNRAPAAASSEDLSSSSLPLALTAPRRGPAALERARAALLRHSSSSSLSPASSFPPALPPERRGERQAFYSSFSIPTGLPSLDRALGGGLPRGALTEITGPLSCGKTSLLFSIVAETARRGPAAGVIVALVDPARSFHAPSAARAGVDLERLLLVAPPAGDVFRVADLLLRSRAFPLVVLDLPFFRRVEGGGRPLFRLVRLAHAVEASLVALTTTERQDERTPALGSAVSLRLSVRPDGLRLEGPFARGYRAAIAVDKDRRSAARPGRGAALVVDRAFPAPLVDPPEPLGDATTPSQRRRRRRDRKKG